MNWTSLARTLLLLGGATLALPGPARAGLPQPLCIFYGQARDGYGLPYRANADVILRHGTNEVARQTIRGSLAPGVNFALALHLDGGRTTARYSRRALRSGEIVSIHIRDAGGERTIMEAARIPPVGKPGDLLMLDVTAAEDLDLDGLPDPWEWELIAWSEGALQSLEDVRGEDDFDGDTASNRAEYEAGTFAFLDYDALLIEELLPTAAGNLRLTFLSVPGKLYTITTAADVHQPAWEPGTFRLAESGPVQVTPVEGDGGWISLYVPTGSSTRFYRITAR